MSAPGWLVLLYDYTMLGVPTSNTSIFLGQDRGYGSHLLERRSGMVELQIAQHELQAALLMDQLCHLQEKLLYKALLRSHACGSLGFPKRETLGPKW